MLYAQPSSPEIRTRTKKRLAGWKPFHIAHAPVRLGTDTVSILHNPAVGHWGQLPAGSPSRSGDVAVYVFDTSQPSLPTPFYTFWICPWCCFCLYGPFNCISFHKFFRQLSAFSLCSPGLISALLVLSTIYLFMKVSLRPDVILCGWPCLERQLTNYCGRKN